MPLEAITYLEDADPNNPNALDQRSEGDDHIRRLKTGLKNTFPGMSGRAWRKRPASASGGITRLDNMVVIHCASGITLVPDTAGSIGNGFMCMVKAPTTGSVTIDPAENINGAASYIVPANYTAILTTDGSEWFVILAFNDIPPNVPAFPSGTKMVFHQTTAPTGWTKLVSSVYNDATIRVTTGTVATGGVDAFTTVHAAGIVTGGHSMTLAENGPHDHTYNAPTGALGNFALNAGANPINSFSNANTSGSSGSGAAHTHPMTMNIKYADVIIASKD